MFKPEAKKTRNFRSLSVALVVFFLALSLSVLFLATGLEIYFNFQIQQKFIIEQQQHAAHDAAFVVESFIQEKFHALEAAVSKKRLQSVNEEERKQVLSELLGTESVFRQAVLFNAQEQELSAVSRLSSFMPGKIKERAGSDLFSQVSQKQTYISPVYIDEVTQEPMIIMAVPVTDVFRDFKGILLAEVNLKFMWNLVDSIKIGEKGLAYVVDKQGDLIAFGDISRVLRGENLINLKEVNDFVNGEKNITKVEILKGILGTNVISTFAPLDTPDWAVVIELPISEAYRSIVQMVLISLGIIFVNIFLIIIISSYLSERITKPIINLRNAARELSQGKLDTRIEIKSENEIGELAADLNEMAGKLKESYLGLEQKIIERTKELEMAKIALEEKLSELERMNKLMVGRELKIIDLKKEVEGLKKHRI